MFRGMLSKSLRYFPFSNVLSRLPTANSTKSLIKYYSPTACKTNTNSAPMALDLEANRIVWIDMEMSGLDIDNDVILEIACIVTDSDLNIIAEGPNLILNTSDDKLDQMNEWCQKQHGKTGLTEAVRKSGINVKEAEDTVCQFLQKHVTKNMSPLAGNSVYMDRLFLRKYMPTLNSYLHYRIIDTSTIKELCRRWNKDVYKNVPSKDYSHRALSDIRESIKELRFYKENFLKCS